MVLVFLAFGFVGLRSSSTRPARRRVAGDLWHLANTTIWKGGDPLPGQVKFTFWHVTFFAWFCNMAMHIGMSDLSVFRFARKSWYGVATAAGMYRRTLHGLDLPRRILYALQLHRDPTNTDVLPGPLAYSALRAWPACICVIIAGWTTANPTIYRAGLAFQAIVPRISRFDVTLVTGAHRTVAGLFPAIAMKLLDFVALYGLLLMPMGAVVFVDFWLIRLGLRSRYADRRDLGFNWAAGLTWFITLGVCTFLVKYTAIQGSLASHNINLLPANFQASRSSSSACPGWFLAAVLYVVLSFVYQKLVHGETAAKAAA